VGEVLMSIPTWLPTPINFLLNNTETKFLVEYYYEFFENELIKSKLIFEGKKIVVNSPKFNCQNKFVKTGKNCNNVLFTCEKCLFKGKEEMFCHVISKKDEAIIPLLKSEYRNYQKSRVPGILVIKRLEKVRWIKSIIDEYNQNKPSEIIYFDDLKTKPGRERIIYFWLKECNFVVILGQNLWDKKQKNILYIKTAYVIDRDETIYMLNRLLKEYKKRLEESSGVS
jgi:hypothetical protein